jgi:hypothetical protein
MRVFLALSGLFSLSSYNTVLIVEHRIVQRIGSTDQAGHVHTVELLTSTAQKYSDTVAIK